MPANENEQQNSTDAEEAWGQHLYTDVGPFAMIPRWFLRKGPSDRAVRLMATMLAEFGGATKNMWPSKKTLGEMMGVSEATVERAIKELREMQVLHVVQRLRPNGSSTSNAYYFTLRDPHEWTPTPSNLSPHGGVICEPPRSISSKKKISSPPLKITDEFKETMRVVYAPRFVDFERKWRSITNSKYLNGRVDQQQYVKDKLDEHVENGWGTRVASEPEPPMVSLDAEAERMGQIWH